MEQFANNPGTTLSAAITSSTRPVTFTVASATGLPTSGNFRVIIDSEILLITTISGLSLTGSNAEGTTAATHLNAAPVTHVITAGALQQLELDVVTTLLNQANTFNQKLTHNASTVTQALSTPAAPTITLGGTMGLTSYSYTVVALQADGSHTIASPAGSTTTGNATLSATNYNIITWTAVANASSYTVYRTVGGSTQGAISTAQTATTLNDTGLAASGSAPTTNNTGGLNIGNPSAISFGASGANWLTWTPTYTPTSPLAIGTPSAVTAKYLIVGSLCFFRLQFTVSITTAGSQLIVSAPINEFLSQIVPCSGYAAPGYLALPVYAAGSQIVINNAALANFATGSTVFYLAGSYQCAG